MTEHATVSRAALTIFGTRAGIVPVKIVIGLIIASLLGATNYGIYSFLILPGAVLVPLMAFGTGLGIRYYISCEEYQARDVAATALTIGLLTGFATSLLLGFLWKYDLLGETGRVIGFDLLLPILLVLPLQGAALSMNRVIVGASWFTAMNLYILLVNLGPPVFLLAFVIVGGFGVTGAIWAIVCANVALALVSILMVYFRFRPRLRFDFGFLRKAGRYGIKAWVGALANQASVKLDQLVLGFVQSPEALGVYRIAVMMAELLWFVPDAVNLPLFNRLSKTKNLVDRLNVVTQSHRVLILVVALLSVGLVAAGWVIIPWILGPEYLDARWLLAILIPGALGLVTARFLGMYFAASGKPETSSAIALVGAIASFVGYLTLIPLFSVAGAAVATTISYLITALTAWYMFAREAKPHRIRLYRATSEDLRWATSLVRDSFSIWRDRMRRAK